MDVNIHSNALVPITLASRSGERRSYRVRARELARLVTDLHAGVATTRSYEVLDEAGTIQQLTPREGDSVSIG